MPLSEADIEVILTSPESGGSMARRFGVTKQAISQIRLGQSHLKHAASTPRRGPAKFCTCCEYWRRGDEPCSLGLPDVITEGLGFAADCELFRPLPVLAQSK